jgi:hypothetical protein
LHIADINMKLASLAWTSSVGSKTGDELRVFPTAKSDTQVVGSYNRFAEDAQRFETVFQEGRVSVRPWLPETREGMVSDYGYTEDDEQLLKAA